jgi:hypothetical protein
MDASTIMSIAKEYALGSNTLELAKKYDLKRNVIKKKLKEVFIRYVPPTNDEVEDYVSSNALADRLGFRVSDVWTVLEKEQWIEEVSNVKHHLKGFSTGKNGRKFLTALGFKKGGKFLHKNSGYYMIWSMPAQLEIETLLNSACLRPIVPRTNTEGVLQEHSPRPVLEDVSSAEKLVDPQNPRLVDGMQLSVRASRCLRNANIATIDELLTKTDEELLQLRNFGKGTLREIRKKLIPLTTDQPTDTSPDNIKLVDEMQLSVRASGCLRNANITTIDELLTKTDEELLQLRNFGKGTLREIRKKLASLANDQPPERSRENIPNTCSQALGYFESDYGLPDNKLLNAWRDIIYKRNYLDLSIREVCLGFGGKWPFKSSLVSDKLVGDFVDKPIEELLRIRGLGKVKSRVFCKAIAFLASGKFEELRNVDAKTRMKSLCDELPGLKGREPAILEARLGKNGKPPTLDELGRKYRVTRERIRQIEKKALEKLRTSGNIKIIDQYLSDNERLIWFHLGGRHGFIPEDEKLITLADELPYMNRFAIQIYTGTMVSGESFPKVLKRFLDNRYQKSSGAWYNLPIESTDLQTLVTLIQCEIRAARLPMPMHIIMGKLAEFDSDHLHFAAQISKKICLYHGYLTDGLTARKKRTIDAHIILGYLERQIAIVSPFHIWEKYFASVPEDNCTPRDIEVCLTENSHLFCRVGSPGWITVGNPCSAEKVFPKLHETEGVECRYHLTPSATLIEKTLARTGIVDSPGLYDELTSLYGFIPRGSVNAYLSKESIFVRYAPGLWGLREWLDSPEIIDSNRSKVLKKSQCKNYLFSRYAGIDFRAYPLWSYPTERLLLEWAEDEDESLFQSLLFVSEPDSWPANEQGSFVWSEQKENSEFCLDLELPLTLWDKPPDFYELLGALVYTSIHGSFNWIQANVISGRRLLIRNGAVTLATLVLLGIVEAEDDWLLPHNAVSDVSPLIVSMKNAYLENPGIDWSNGLAKILIPLMAPRLKEPSQGWLNQEVVERLLKAWCRCKKKNFGKEIEKALDEIGFEWKPESSSRRTGLHGATQARIAEVKAFKENHGHWDPPRDSRENRSLRLWVDQQRSKKRKGKLSEEVEAALDEIRFEWEPSSTPRQASLYGATLARVVELKAFKETYGHFDSPRHLAAEHPGLRQWVDQQRSKKRKGKLSQKVETALDEIGFEWEPSSFGRQSSLYGATLERVAELKSYNEAHGHFDPPRDSVENRSLRQWVDQQRFKKRKGQLSQTVEAALDEIGFEWEPESTPRRASLYGVTLARVVELKGYKEAHGHFDPPRDSVENRGLRQWVDQQRSKKRKGKLSEEVEEALNEIGFEWEPSSSNQRASQPRIDERKEGVGEYFGKSKADLEELEEIGDSLAVAELQRRKLNKKRKRSKK